MKATVHINGKEYSTDLSKGIDISIPLRTGDQNVNAWYVPPVSIEPVRMGDWVGDVNQGGSVNFRNIVFNPHGNGTHTECVGHISKENISVNQCLKQFFFFAELVTVNPVVLENMDKVITRSQLEMALKGKSPQAVILRSLPNAEEKLQHHYSNTNPPYLLEEAANFLDQLGVDHLMIDLPSVDKEVDEGKLLAHHAFWRYPQDTQFQRTITEMIFVPDSVKDGSYLLNIQIASFENDASPSKPVLYAFEK